MKLVFEVELGNEAMQNLGDVKAAFESTVGRGIFRAGLVGWFDEIDEGYVGTNLTVWDVNGNSVGTLSIVEEEVVS